MARIGKARVLGSSAIIKVSDGTTACAIGEIDKFSAKENTELKKSRPIGAKLFTTQVDPQGWDLSFEGGKVDWNIAALMQAQSRQFYGNNRSVYFEVEQSITFFDGKVETYIYHDVTLHGLNLDIGGSGDEISEKFEGFAAYREVDDKSIAATVTDALATTITALLVKMTDQKPGGDTGSALTNSSSTKIGT